MYVRVVFQDTKNRLIDLCVWKYRKTSLMDSLLMAKSLHSKWLGGNMSRFRLMNLTDAHGGSSWKRKTKVC